MGNLAIVALKRVMKFVDHSSVLRKNIGSVDSLATVACLLPVVVAARGTTISASVGLPEVLASSFLVPPPSAPPLEASSKTISGPPQPPGSGSQSSIPEPSGGAEGDSFLPLFSPSVSVPGDEGDSFLPSLSPSVSVPGGEGDLFLLLPPVFVPFAADN